MKDGVTLLELLVVVLIIAILAVIAVPKFDDIRARAVLAEAYSLLDAIRLGQEDYFLENEKYSDGILDLEVELPVRDERRFDYGTGIGIGLHETDPGNDEIYMAVSSDQEREHDVYWGRPHIHERGQIGMWVNSSTNHTHGDISHSHDPTTLEYVP